MGCSRVHRLKKPFVQRVRHTNVSLAKWIGVLTKCIHSIRSSHRNCYGIQRKYNRIQNEVRGNQNNQMRWNKMENSIPKAFACGWNGVGYVSFRNYFSNYSQPLLSHTYFYFGHQNRTGQKENVEKVHEPWRDIRSDRIESEMSSRKKRNESENVESGTKNNINIVTMQKVLLNPGLYFYYYYCVLLATANTMNSFAGI